MNLSIASIIFLFTHGLWYSVALYHHSKKSKTPEHLLRWVRFSWTSHHFLWRTETKFCPQLLHLECRATKLCVYKLVDTSWKESTLSMYSTRFYSKYFTCYSCTNTQGSQEFIPNLLFTCRQFDIVVLNLKPIHCPLPSDLPTNIQPMITSFLAGA